MRQRLGLLLQLWPPALSEAALLHLHAVSPACLCCSHSPGQEFPGEESHHKFLKCPVLLGPVYVEALLENVAELNFQFLM